MLLKPLSSATNLLPHSVDDLERQSASRVFAWIERLQDDAVHHVKIVNFSFGPRPDEPLFLLDHYASDASWNVFRLALRDPVASVREVALHGLSCERCRTTALCVADVVADLVDILVHDPSAEVRHKTVAVLARFADRDERVIEAIARAAEDKSGRD
jgi:hypothetical protein